MSTSLIPDPFQMWREALTKLEGNVNTLVTGSMDSQELMRSMHQLSTLSLGMQQAFEEAHLKLVRGRLRADRLV